MPESPFERFCGLVCAQVRCHSAHADITAELTAHLEDHAAALMDRGMSEEEAQAAAVAAMGDPEKIGAGLDRCYSPALEMAQILVHLAACLAAAALFILAFGAWGEQHAGNPTDFWWESGLCGSPDVSSASVRAGWYTIAAGQGDLEREPSGAYTFRCVLTIWALNPWLSEPGFLDQPFLALEPSGKAYTAELCHAAPFGPLRHYSFLTYALVEVPGVSPDCTRLTLAFPRAERQYFLTIPLTGGESDG